MLDVPAFAGATTPHPSQRSNRKADATMGLENPLHILILLLVVLLVFGAKRLPELGRSLGDGMRGFRDSLQGEAPAAGAIAPAPAVGVELQTAAAEVPAPPR